MIIISYLFYNLLVGIFLCIYYLYNEKKIVQTKEFILLFLLPAIGIGTWFYNKKQREGIENSYSKKWYIYKYMLKFNRLYVCVQLLYISLALVLLYILSLRKVEYLDNIPDILAFFLFFLSIFSKIIAYLPAWLLIPSFLCAILYPFTINYILFIIMPKNRLKKVENNMKLEQQQNHTEDNNLPKNQ